MKKRRTKKNRNKFLLKTVSRCCIGLVGLIVMPVAIANVCPAPLYSGDLFTPGGKGGVALDKALEVLADRDINGAAYDPETGQLVFISDGEVAAGSNLDKDDLVVAARSVMGYGETPSIDFAFGGAAEWTRASIDGYMNVFLSSSLENTHMGKALFDADYVLKKLGQGVDEDGVLLTNQTKYPGLYCNDPNASTCLQYKSSAERMFELGAAPKDNLGNDLLFQYWISPKSVKLNAHGNAQNVNDDKSFTFTATDGVDVEMQVSCQIYSTSSSGTQNLLVDKEACTLTGSSASIPNNGVIPAAAAFANNITDKYDDYAAIPEFSSLGKLKQLAKTVAVLKWVRDNKIPFDLSFMADYEPTAVLTDKYVKMLQLCANSSWNVDASKSGEYTVPAAGSGCSGHKIIGGVDYATENDQTDTVEATIFETVRTELAAQTGLVENDGHVSWDIAETSSKAIALSAKGVKKDGNVAFGSYDLATEYLGTSAGLTRYYDSFSSRKSKFGPGWSELPYVLTFSQGSRSIPEKPDVTGSCTTNEFLTEDHVVAEPLITLKDYTAGVSAEFNFAGWVWSDDCNSRVPYYLSPSSDDWIYRSRSYSDEVINENTTYVDFWVYEQRDKSNNVSKFVRFFPRLQSMQALPEHVEVATSAGKRQTVLDYSYAEEDQLDAIYVGEYPNHTRKIQLFYNDDRIDSAIMETPSGSRRVSYAYDEHKRLQGIVKPNGAELNITYQDRVGDLTPSRFVAQITDATRNEAILTVNPDATDANREYRIANVLPENDSDQRVTVTYDKAANTVTRTVVNTDEQTELTRDGQNRIDTVVLTGNEANVSKSRTAVDYDFAHSHELAGPSSITNIRGKAVTYDYDNAGRVIKITDAKLRETIIERGVDASGNAAVVVTDRKGRKSAVVTDENGRVLEIYRRLASAERTTLEAADPNDPNSVPKYQFTLVEQPGYKTIYNYAQDSGELESVSTAVSGTLASIYPWLDTSDITNIIGRDSLGKITGVTSPTGRSSSFNYDGFGRLTSTQGPADLQPVNYKYNDSGLTQDSIKSVATILGGSSVDIDVINRSRSVIDNRGVTTTHFYNRKGQLHKVIEIAPDVSTVLTTQYIYDEFGKLDKKILPNGMQVQYGYNWLNQVASMQEIEGSQTNSAPAISNLPSQENNLNQGDTYSFDLAATDADGDAITYSVVHGPKGVVLTDSTTAGQTSVSWTPAEDQTGSQYIIVQADDGKGGLQNIKIGFTVDDGILSAVDNCTDVANPGQLDSDNDGYGNACDPDLNNDGVVNFADLAMFKSVFGTDNIHADFNSDGIVNILDLAVLEQAFGSTPGPSGGAQ